MDKIERTTPDLTQENVDRLAELFPSVVTETLDEEGKPKRAIDFDALRDLLSDDVVEGRRERYQFTWPGKAKARLEARTPTNKTMRPCPEKSVDWDTTQNLYIEGDNLEALKNLRETYAGKVKLIYIYSPYNTGHDFVYDDDFGQTRAEYEAESGDFDAEDGGTRRFVLVQIPEVPSGGFDTLCDVGEERLRRVPRRFLRKRRRCRQLGGALQEVQPRHYQAGDLDAGDAYKAW